MESDTAPLGDDFTRYGYLRVPLRFYIPRLNLLRCLPSTLSVIIFLATVIHDM